MLKTLHITIALSCVAMDLYGQTPTAIGPHQLGETFEQWLSINSIDMVAVCQKHHGDRALCKRFSAIRDTGRGHCYIVMQNISMQPFDFVFSNGIVEEVSTEYPNPDLQHQLEFLKSAYGPPAISDTVAYQNGYGATWNCQRFSWNMPDGAAIHAAESIKPTPEHMRVLTVTFVSREWRAKVAAEDKADPNPYGKR
jgi:hypothetical protein